MRVVAVLLLLGLFSCKSAPPPDFDKALWLQSVKTQELDSVYAPHVDTNGTFFNPWMQRPEHRGNWRNRDKKEFDDFPVEKYSHLENDYSYLLNKNFDSISYAGHSSMIIKMNGDTIFTDPFFSNRALILSKKLKLKFDFSKVPDQPIVLISHNHYDHLDKKSVKQMIKKNAVFLVPLKLKNFFIKLGAKEVYELDWWESVRIGSLNYTFLPAQHWSRRLGQKAGTTLWGGWLVEGSKTVYFSGDSGYFRGFEEFGNRYEIDYAIIGAGAYEPRWFMHYSHLNVQEFFLATDDLNAKFATPFHFGVITLSDEPLTYPLYEIEQHIGKYPEYANRIKPLRVGEYFRMEE
ncbi:MAG: MBL fold metallo-hydrolase [Treponema sp.]|jgi:L-ascorbate metabolism protein UlaG (beta-lactamase superfamily)|nr:MBL fold metallo-hydrolase [Treponema sp.]